MLITALSWAAICILAFSYWFQIVKIQVHKEVRDISLWYHILLALGFGMLIITAVAEGSTIFFWKQVLTFIPVIIIIIQILYHQKDRWHDDEDPICQNCKEEWEPDWKFCAYCGSNQKEKPPRTKRGWFNIS